VVVAGGGAAGLAAAISAARAGAQVTVIEADARLGKKILATGNGRCNLSNASIEGGTAASAYHNAQFAQGALGKRGCASVRAFFEDLGLMTVKDERGWVFPRSRWANSVLDVLLDALRSLGIACLSGARVTRLTQDGACLLVHSKGSEARRADAVIIATGNSNISGLVDGHVILPLQPVLGPVQVDPGCVKGLDGVRCRCAAALVRGGDVQAVEAGEVLFRKDALSGIAVFNLSRHAQPGDQLALDFFEGVGPSELEAHLARRACQPLPQGAPCTPSMPLANGEWLHGLVHNRLGQAVLRMAGLDPAAKAEPGAAGLIAAKLQNFCLTVEGLPNANQAQVMRGGLSVGGFEAGTLASKQVPGLFAAGEALDVDGPCGGYNLHWAWASGIEAGRSAAMAP
jgi:predicted Rossmann fold flavoprotein